MESDPFEDVLNLEDQYYDQGYNQGYEDGYQAGKIEGRSVGLKSGYEKFIEAGRLQGKAIVWANRLPNLREIGKKENDPESSKLELPRLASNARLEKNVSSLHALVEPGTLSTQNNDEAVNDFDDRFKRAQGKLKIVERMLGEEAGKMSPKESSVPLRDEI